MRHTETCLPRRHKGPVRNHCMMNLDNRQNLWPCPLHNRCMWSNPPKARTSRARSWHKRSHQRSPHIYPLHMRHNAARCRNRGTQMPFPPRSRCMLHCRLSFCICQLRMTRTFPTLLSMLDHNSRPPPSPPENTQRTRSQAPRREAACGTPGARLYTRGASCDIGLTSFRLRFRFIPKQNGHEYIVACK